MNDHAILPIHRDADILDQPIDTPSLPSTSRRRKENVPVDRRTRSVAEILGTSATRAARILSAVGGLEALAFASEADLVAASLSRPRARLVRAAFELARESIGARPQIGKRLAGAAAVQEHMRARLAGPRRGILGDRRRRPAPRGSRLHDLAGQSDRRRSSPPRRLPPAYHSPSLGGHLLSQPPVGRSGAVATGHRSHRQTSGCWRPMRDRRPRSRCRRCWRLRQSGGAELAMT